MTPLTAWATTNPWPAAAAAAVSLLAVIGAAWAATRPLRAADRPPAAVVMAAVAAAGCTAYSADTSWAYARDHLGMTSTTERAAMFAAAEIALFATALMARQNLRTAGAPGTPGVLVWVITGVQIIPAYAESGVWGGTVRAFVGPILAALLWHLAMGIELRHSRPGADSQSLPALLARELRERLLSRLGLSVRDRTAEQISRDRAMARAVRLASRPRLRGWGRRRLAAAVARARVGTDGEARHRLLRDLAARRTSGELATVPLASPWTGTGVPEGTYPSTPLGVAGAELRRLHPVDAIQRVHAGHPDATPAEVAALCTGYGVPVSETQVRVALRAGNRPPAPAPVAPVEERPVLPPTPEPVPGPDLLLDLSSTPEVHPQVRSRIPVLAARRTHTPQVHARVPEQHAETAAPRPDVPAEHPRPAPVPETGVPVPDSPSTPTGTDALLARARVLDAEYRAKHGRPAPVRALKTALRIGQPKVDEIRARLRAEYSS
ncbi:hypothetical protein AB0J25_11955 [Streptomyces sp. NPDC049910]|uniref:hypothetical protein n=1 Tax=Streptomyces sp. NPDC049910 TaxID=3155278 RepID=UPI0034382568